MGNNQNSEKNLTSGVMWKFMERFLAQGVSFVVSVILARLLMPDDYGVISIVMIFIEIATVFIVSGLNSALIQKKDINEEETSTIFYCCIMLGAFLYGLLFITAPLISSVFEMPILTPVIRVFALRLPIASIQQVPAALISRALDFRKFFWSTMVGTVISAIVGIAMAVGGYGVWALVAQNLVAALCDSVILFAVAKWRPKKMFSLKKTSSLITYGFRIMTADFISVVFNNLCSIIMGYKFTESDVAYYTKGKNLPYLFRNNIYLMITSVLFPVMSKVNDDLAEVKSVARRSIKMLAYVLFPIMIGMICVAEDMVLALYTKKWILMVPFIVIVCIESMISIIPTILLQALKATGHSGIIFKMVFIRTPILFASLLISVNFGVKAVALTLPFNTMVELVLDSIVSSKKIGYKITEQIKDILCPLFLSLGMCVAIYLMSFINTGLILGLALKVLVGMVTYVLLSVIFKVEEFKSLWGIVKSKIG
ncbi:MAG: lipopolysaccharide biosynthesis protein [Ruminococcaceae bacterium]|nr:lipopolysaccharide biosynthesis protein [Oscillospiraceae bacterium]